MNPNMYNNYQYPQQIPQIQQHIEPRILSYPVDSGEQLATLPPMPNTIYVGISRDGSKMFQRRMNNDGLMELKTFVLQQEQTKKTDMQEILERISNIEKKIGGQDESTNAA